MHDHSLSTLGTDAHILLYRVNLVMIGMIGTDWTGSFKSKYHTIKTAMAKENEVKVR
jgi:hypothetical protein